MRITCEAFQDVIEVDDTDILAAAHAAIRAHRNVTISILGDRIHALLRVPVVRGSTIAQIIEWYNVLQDGRLYGPQVHFDDCID